MGNATFQPARPSAALCHASRSGVADSEFKRLLQLEGPPFQDEAFFAESAFAGLKGTVYNLVFQAKRT